MGKNDQNTTFKLRKDGIVRFVDNKLKFMIRFCLNLYNFLLNLCSVSVVCVSGKQIVFLGDTYPPCVAELEASWGYWVVCLATQEACKSSVSVHHCNSHRQHCRCIICTLCRRRLQSCRMPGARLSSGSHVLCLSHWSTECLARLPPFCMCLILERAAPVKPNMLLRC